MPISWGSGSKWVEWADGKVRQRQRGLWIVGHASGGYNRLLRTAFLRRAKHRGRRKVSPSTARFNRRHV